MDFRHEYKYIISVQHAMILRERLSGIMQKDIHGGKSGSYEIRSIYFDDESDSCYHQNEAGTDPRSKYRIRIYDASKERIMLEKKIKKNGMTKKLQQTLTPEEYRILTDSDIHDFPAFILSDDMGKLFRELFLLKQTRLMQPKVIVSYERTPFTEGNGNVRVTFDDGMASSPDFDAFFERKLHARPIMPAGMTLMEVKYDEFLPAYIKEVLETGHLRQTNFSKYYLCRRYHL